jgi:hypothetical protein
MPRHTLLLFAVSTAIRKSIVSMAIDSRSSRGLFDQLATSFGSDSWPRV